MMQNRAISIFLVIGIVVLVNVLSMQYFLRLDLTEDKQYTLSDATRNVLESLDKTVTVTGYFTESLPPDLEIYRTDFRDLLVEYASRSGGNVEYRFINPNEDQQTEQEAVQKGITPRLVNVREKDQFTQQRAYMGALLNMGDSEEVIPFIGPGVPMEYSLTTAIKKMAVTDKPSVAFLTGHGEPDLGQLGQVVQALSVVFSVETIDLSTDGEIPLRYKAVALVAPTDSITPSQFERLDQYLAGGGRLIVAVNAVEGDFRSSMGTAVESSVIDWLADKGIQVEPAFVIDASSGSVTVQQRQGFFTINTPVKFPYLPIVSNFPEHPATQGLEQVIFQFVSPMRYSGDSSNYFTPLVLSSKQSGIAAAPVFFDVAGKKWSQADFPMADIVMGGVLEGNVGGNTTAKLVVYGDGDFPVGSEGRGANPDNVNLLVNTIEWLGDDTGLTQLRTKGVSSRPIEELEEGRRQFLKYVNFFLPIILVVVYGIFRSQRNKTIRLKRMQERYV